MSSLGPDDIQRYSDATLHELYPESLKLILVQAIFRHGERAPVRVRLENAGIPRHFNLCEHVSHFDSAIRMSGSSDWGRLRYRREVEEVDQYGKAKSAGVNSNTCLLGELTDKGRATTLQLGKRLRDLYVDRLGFVKNMPKDEELYMRSSPMPRALESLQQVYTGLFPPELHRPNDSLPTIRQRNFTEENLYPNEGMCKKLRLLSEEYADKAAKKWNPILAGRTTEILSKYIEGPIAVDGSPRLSGIMDTINTTRGNDLPIAADLLDPEMLSTMHTAVVEEWFGGYLANMTYRRLGAGRLLGDLRDQIVSVTNNSQLKFALYGCHDTTLGALLSSVGGFDNQWPPFTSHIAIETFERSDPGILGYLGRKDYLIRLRYNDRIVSVQGCANPALCTLKEFEKVVDSLVPANWQQECELNEQS